jgi:hypothetical protein
MAATRAAMTVGGCDRIMDREAPGSLLCCLRGCAPGGARSSWGASLRGEEWFLHGKNDERDAIQLGIGEG